MNKAKFQEQTSGKYNFCTKKAAQKMLVIFTQGIVSWKLAPSPGNGRFDIGAVKHLHSFEQT
jgi:hypothetical protein